MQAVNLRSFKQKVRHNKRSLKRFLTKIEKNPPRGLDKITAALEPEVWKEVDCLTCANCCKTTSPIFINSDIERLAKSFNIKPGAFIDKHFFNNFLPFI